MKKHYVVLFSLLLLCIGFTSCSKPDNSIVIYTSVDRNYSEPILKDFEVKTGIKVLAVYDVEATKTTGLVNRLIGEKNNPRADVFWNGEISQTLKLKKEDVLDVYTSEKSKQLPSNFVDSDGYWTAFGGRARVFIVNTNIVNESNYPESVFDFISSHVKANTTAVAKPLFGTTATHVAALYAVLGKEKIFDLFSGIASSEVNIVDGNSAVRDLVASGKLAFGLTDTDDALSAMNKNLPVDIVFPDQGDNMPGTLVMPNSVGIIKNGPNRKNAEIFVDYILSDDTMKLLIESGWCQVSMRDIAVDYPFDICGLKVIDIPFEDIANMLDTSAKDMSELFIK